MAAATPQAAAAQSGGSAPAGGRADLRLALGALSGWLAAAATLSGTAAAGCLAGGIGVLAAAGTLGLRRTWAPAVALALGCAGIATVATAVRVHARDASPLTRLADLNAAATVHLVVRDDPRPVRARSASGGDRVLLLARAQRVRSGGREWTVADEVLVLAPSAGWSGLLPSQRV